jgi:hypothetical protein
MYICIYTNRVEAVTSDKNTGCPRQIDHFSPLESLASLPTLRHMASKVGTTNKGSPTVENVERNYFLIDSLIKIYRTAFKSRLRAHGTEFSPRRPFKCPVHM